MKTQDEMQRRAIRQWSQKRPLWVLDALIDAVADVPEWQAELRELRELRTRIDYAYRRRRGPGQTSAASEWLSWIQATGGR